jgi:2-polyprenyl-6-methoxyphenol hydroxylase-like FAD-dependent oxidoreductase
MPQGNNEARVYLQMPPAKTEELARKQVTMELIQETMNLVIAPYKMKWTRVDWWSAYPIRQGIAEKYKADDRVFLGGDTCHVHSVGLPSRLEVHTNTNQRLGISPRQVKE